MAGSCDLLSATLPASTSVMPPSAAFLTKTLGAGVLSASAAMAALDAPLSARKRTVWEMFMSVPSMSCDQSVARTLPGLSASNRAPCQRTTKQIT